MLTGSCLCSGVRYELRGSIKDLGHCHCTMCQKFHGTAFGTYARVKAEEFRVVRGADLIAEYRSSEGVKRTFCRTCGSPLQFEVRGKPFLGIAAGSLDSDPLIKPSYQIWTRSKACWWDLDTDLLCHESEP